MEWWCTEANEATQTHCYNPVAPVYFIWAYYAHGRQQRCQEDPVSLPSGRLEKITRLSPHHVAQHHPTGSETSSYAPQSSRFGSEPPSVEDDVDVWCYAIVSCTPETTTTNNFCMNKKIDVVIDTKVGTSEFCAKKCKFCASFLRILRIIPIRSTIVCDTDVLSRVSWLVGLLKLRVTIQLTLRAGCTNAT